jgi:hypothetical protein
MRKPKFWEKMNKGHRQFLFACIIGVVAYFTVFRFTWVEYRDKAIMGYVFGPLSDVLSGDHEGIFLGSAELETRFGTVRVKPFCRFSALNHSLRYIRGRNFVNGMAEHNIAIIGNILENPGFTFERDDIRSMAFNQTMDIQGYLFDSDYISLRYNESIGTVEIVIVLNFNPDVVPDRIVLSDGTQIGLKTDYPTLFLTVQDVAKIWKLGVRSRNIDYIFVTQSEEAEPIKFVEITFEENWGKFIDGIPFEGQR